MTPQTAELPIETFPEEIIYKRMATDIVVRIDRHRQKFSRKPLDQLIDSIRETGQTQPGVCYTNPDGNIELLVGERRLRACMALQVPFRYYVKEEVLNPLLLEQIQLDENLCREDLDWREEILAKARMHKILTTMYGEATSGIVGGHTIAMTAEHIGVKRSILQEDVTLAGFLSVPEVEAAPNKTTAKKIVKRMIEQVQRHEQLKIALSAAKKSAVEDQAPLTETARAELALTAKHTEDRRKAAGLPPLPEVKTQTVLEKQLIYYNKRCLLGKMEEKLLAFEDNSFDIVCFDPPWGVEFDSVRQNSPGTKTYEDDWETFWANLENWLILIYQKMKPDSHLYMFFGIVAHGFVYDTLEATGFNTNRMPLIWHKKGAHVTRNPTVWPGRSYEPIAYARKGNKPLAKQGAPDVIETPMPTPSIKDIHPSAKHPMIYRELLLRSASPSDTILDPMSGSGMFGVAAEHLTKTHALNWFQIEKDSDYRNLELLNLTKGYEAICRGSSGTAFGDAIEDEGKTYAHQDWTPEPLPEDFKSIKPGTEQWRQYWQEHPEKQDEMLAWRSAQL